MKLSQIAVDVAAEEKGEWMDLERIDADFKGVSVCVRSNNNNDYVRLYAKLSKGQTRKLIRNQAVDPVETQEIIAECLARTVLLGWRGIEDENGELAYTPDTALRILKDRSYRRFREVVLEAAEEVGKQRGDSIEEISGN